MANIHPFFAGVSVDTAASWTYSFWSGKDKQFWKSDSVKNVISETGWPSGGGKDCGASTTCGADTPGAVASVENMNHFMNDWVCQALANGTNYFWFEAFDEPWKVRFNEKGKEWEDKWGLMDVNRKLKSGIKIPDCGGKTV
jgi:exo-beta-1,3-glucanase (GH17 family)